MNIKTARNAFMAAAFLGLCFTGYAQHEKGNAADVIISNPELGVTEFASAYDGYKKWDALSTVGLIFSTLAVAGLSHVFWRGQRMQQNGNASAPKPSI